jgi:Domain of unknown function (DUF4864)
MRACSRSRSAEPGRRRLALAFVGLLLLPAAAHAQAWEPRDLPLEPDLPRAAPAAADMAAIRAVIEAQRRAFVRRDGDAAFALASPGLQARYQRASNFMAMVAAGYDAVFRARRFEPREFLLYRGYLTERVLVTGPDGAPVVALYMMTRDPRGAWRIAGCVLAKPALSS